MIPEIGYFALVLALISSLSLAFLPLISLQPYKKIYVASLIIPILVTIALLCLLLSFILSDFSVMLVMKHSHSAKPLLYKITGSWGNHEGSMLLWLWLLTLFIGIFALCSHLEWTLKSTSLAILGAITSAFCSFILLTSNPFARIFPAAEEGMGLNPLLQDIGLAIHPPLLYTGYVGCAISFAAACALLMHPNYPIRQFANKLKPWVSISWCFLTLGIALGSWWAYRELGWGGYWFWDPVENASLLPWLSATALLHSLIVTQIREQLAKWTIMLSLLTFILSLLGTFLVRSGVLTSVHAFANDPNRGIFILALISVAIITSLSLFALKADTLPTTKQLVLKSKEGMMLCNTTLLLIAAATVLLGTIYPLILEAFTGKNVAVGAPYYHKSFNYIALVILALAAFGPYFVWKKRYKKTQNSIFFSTHCFYSYDTYHNYL